LESNNTNVPKVSSCHLSKILVPIDGSESSMEALELAVDLAVKYKSKICIVNVIPTYQLYHWLTAFGCTFFYEDALFPSGILREMEEESKSFLMSTLTSIQSIGVESYAIIGKGHQASEIVRIAKEENVDLIVIGNNNPNIFARLIFGSVSHSVAHKAPCPVLIVKREKTHDSQNSK